MVHLIDISRSLLPQPSGSVSRAHARGERLRAKSERAARRHEFFGGLSGFLGLAVACAALYGHATAPATSDVFALPPVASRRALAATGCECLAGASYSTAVSASSSTCGCSCTSEYYNGTGCAAFGLSTAACLNMEGDKPLPRDFLHVTVAGTPNSDRVCVCDEFHDWQWYDLAWKIAIIVYLFMGIAIVCDDFFEDSLTSLSREFHLSNDVAGATFMAAGSSAPELFTSMAAVMFDYTPHCPGDQGHANVGVGTIVGSAIFNILMIIGVTAMLAGGIFQLDWKPFMRDAGFYAMSIVLLTIVINDSAIYWWEASILLGGYVVYVAFLSQNEALLKMICPCGNSEEGKGASLQPIDTASVAGAAAPSAAVPSPTVGTLVCEKEKLVSDEKPGKEEASEAPGGAAAYCGCGCIGNPDVSFMEHIGMEDDGEPTMCECSVLSTVLLGLPSILGKDGWACGQCKAIGVCASAMKTCEFSLNITWLSKINAVLCIPWYLVFKFTIPCCDGDEDSDEEDGDGDEEGGAKTDPKDDEEAGEKEEEEKQDQWEHWTWCIPKYWITFFMAVGWIGAICYWMVEYCVEVGKMLDVSTAVMGLTVLSAGTSVPDALASINVAQKGKANMAVSNALGSNVFDIMLGLGLPYLLANIKSMLRGNTHNNCDVASAGLVLGQQIPVCMCTKDVEVYLVALFLVLFLTLIMFSASQFKLHPGVGIWMIFLYAAFAFAAIGRDQDLFAKDWLGESCK